MIRRGFWFAAGAVAGIVGYRRVSRAARTLVPAADLLAPIGRRIAGQTAKRALGPAPCPHHQAGSRGQAGRMSGAGRAVASQTRTGQKAVAGTAAFVRDVRAGMTDYLDARGGM